MNHRLATMATLTEAEKALNQLRVFQDLKHYKPILVGTFPIEINIESSDLDVLCEVYDMNKFAAELKQLYAHQQQFSLCHKIKNDLPVVIARFEYDRFPIEIFGQPRPVLEQVAYVHMIIEKRLLELGGRQAKAKIKDLKRQGIKTEPAFASYFHLPGDPYQVLLDLAKLETNELISRLKKFH